LIGSRSLDRPRSRRTPQRGERRQRGFRHPLRPPGKRPGRGTPPCSAQIIQSCAVGYGRKGRNQSICPGRLVTCDRGLARVYVKANGCLRRIVNERNSPVLGNLAKAVGYRRTDR
jgi:hypothetical protein